MDLSSSSAVPGPKDLSHEDNLSAPPTKKLRVFEPLTACFRHEKCASLTNEVIQDLVTIFEQKFPALSRCTIADLPEGVPITGYFSVLQVSNCRGQCNFMQQKRWRLVCREILPGGVRGGCVFLTVTDYLPVMAEEIPAELRVPGEFQDIRLAPVVLIAGFIKEQTKFKNPNWEATLLCGADSVPQVWLATVPKPCGSLFVHDFNDVQQLPTACSPALVQEPMLPFAALINAQQVAAAAGNGNRTPAPRGPNVSTANSGGYTPVAELIPRTQHYSNVIAVVRSFLPPKLVNKGRSYMQCFHIVDPSMDIANDAKTLCLMYKPTLDKLAPISKAGDIILLKNLHVVVYNDQKQCKLYDDTGRFSVVADGGFGVRPGSHFSVPIADHPRVTRLREWYEEFAGTIVADLEERRVQAAKADAERKAQLQGTTPPVDRAALPELAPKSPAKLPTLVRDALALTSPPTVTGSGTSIPAAASGPAVYRLPPSRVPPQRQPAVPAPPKNPDAPFCKMM
ncbi:hypothetical protein BV898_05603 [Hypsibius exemplaris]|uniref:Telomeric single stranded DNA binding POT1/Cdc13 domain-containing protein n=1 Tax=Hypsibius exemplaris TaxID=2072580 RepID=A0A1W0WYQ0_HYPEX|nr:hypothetical protein BV898_05603 [Hypsibius exemplaris]